MKLLKLTTFLTVSLLIISGCTLKPSPKKVPVIDESLPIVELTKNGTLIDMNAIAFEWKSIKDTKVNGIYIYKLGPNSRSTEPTHYATVDSRFTTHFLDTDIKPDNMYQYYFKTYSDTAESLKSKLLNVNSLPVIQSVSWISKVDNMPRSAKIIWRPHSNQKVKAYFIERSTLENTTWEKIATVSGRLNAEYIDSNLNDKYTYKYRVLSLTYDDITSTPSEIVTVVTKALPENVSDIKASRDLPKKIQLNWNKSKIKDLQHYNVYRSVNVDGGYNVIRNTKHNSFTDNIEEDGKQYFYRVSSVDKDGLESIYDKQSIQGLTLVKPTPPSVVEAKIVEDKVKLNWSNTDPRTITYIVVKRYKKGLFEEINEEFIDINKLEFIDSSIEPDTTYYYRIFGVDKNGIKSNSSMEVELKTKKEEVLPANTKENVEASKIEVKEVVTPTDDININDN